MHAWTNPVLLCSVLLFPTTASQHHSFTLIQFYLSCPLLCVPTSSHQQKHLLHVSYVHFYFYLLYNISFLIIYSSLSHVLIKLGTTPTTRTELHLHALHFQRNNSVTKVQEVKKINEMSGSPPSCNTRICCLVDYDSFFFFKCLIK